jgi:Fe-S cluster assembly protein SufB
MKQTYEDLGIPQAEREHLAGVVGVWRQEPVYEGLKEEYAKQGILFCSMDTAITEYPELVQKYFMTKCVPAQDNKFSALRGLVRWSLLLHPQGRQVRPAAAVLLPHGGRRRGHLRAHADHR